MHYGLREYEIRNIIMRSIKKNPDLEYYIDNEYIYELIEAVVNGVSRAIEKNTDEVIKQITRELKGR